MMSSSLTVLDRLDELIEIFTADEMKEVIRIPDLMLTTSESESDSESSHSESASENRMMQVLPYYPQSTSENRMVQVFPYHPQMNGQAEAHVRRMKAMLKRDWLNRE